MRDMGNSNNKGIALILVVSILAVAGIMAVSFAFTMRLELKSASNFLEATRASYLAESGVTYAQAVIKEDEPDIDSFQDAWATLFEGFDVDNDGDGELDSKWIYVYDDLNEPIGRYAVLVRDESGFLNINIADKQNISPLKVTEGWTPHELDLQSFLASFELSDSQKTYEDILDHRLGLDGEPGEMGVDDNDNQRILAADGIDNNADGIIDEAGEGIDEPMEFVPSSPYADDNAFETPFELAKIQSIKESDFTKIYPYITSYSPDKNLDVEGRLRENINFMDAATLLVLLEDAGASDPFQKAVNIIDACDEDFSQSVVSKLYNRLSAVNRGPIGDWVWRGGHYESDVEDSEPLVITWLNLPEGEFYIGVFGVAGEYVGDVAINGVSQGSVRHGEILRIGTVSFEERDMLELTVENKEEDEVCYFSYLELYPRLGQEGFSAVEVRGVEGIRINEIMARPSTSLASFNGQDPGGDWTWQGSYFQNDEPNGGKTGEGDWTWQGVPNGQYYVKVFGMQGQEVGDVEIGGARSRDMLDGELFGGGKTITVSNEKITVRVQNNLNSGSAYFQSIELTQEPDAEYIELVNLTSNEVNLGGWSVEGPSKQGWPASIPLGTVIGPDEHLVLCVDRDDSQDGIQGNDISFVSIWGQEKSAELHFVKAVVPGSDLLSNEPHPDGNIITLKDPMGHIVDAAEYFSGGIPANKSLERSDPSYVVDSNLNGIPEGWYTSDAEDGATPGLPNDNEGMIEEIEVEGQIEKEIIEHDITEVVVKNKNFSSVGEIGFVSSGLKEWDAVPLEDVSKIADRLTVFGIRLEAEDHIVPGSEGAWKMVQRASPLTDHFENGEAAESEEDDEEEEGEGDSVGVWRWEEKDGIRNGYYTLRIFGEEEEEIAVSLHLADDTWTAFTPPLSPGPGGSVLFGNIEIGTDSEVSTPSNELELKIKNVSKTGGAHFDFIRLDPVNTIDGKININTASKKVLSALPGIDEGIADDIVANRIFGDNNGLRLGIGDLISTDALGREDEDKRDRFRQISNLVTVHSDVYRIIVTAQTLDEDRVLSEKKIWVVFER